jgi:hypothetical protein
MTACRNASHSGEETLTCGWRWQRGGLRRRRRRGRLSHWGLTALLPATGRLVIVERILLPQPGLLRGAGKQVSERMPSRTGQHIYCPAVLPVPGTVAAQRRAHTYQFPAAALTMLHLLRSKHHCMPEPLDSCRITAAMLNSGHLLAAAAGAAAEQAAHPGEDATRQRRRDGAALLRATTAAASLCSGCRGPLHMTQRP